MASSQITAVIGMQWGDEGKGKIVDLLAKDVDIVGRFNGGSNAGHTIVVGNQKFAFHLVPSGVLYDKVSCVVGNGVVVNLPGLFKEFETLEASNINFKGRFFISDRAHLLFDFHKQVDGMKEVSLGKDAIGTTKQGIGPCYSNKTQRTGIRVGDLRHFDKVFVPKFKELVESAQKSYGHFECDVEKEINLYREYSEKILPMVIDTIPYLANNIKQGKRLLVEGANAHMLDIDYGTYPYVTSSNTTIGGVGTGLGIPPQKIGQSIGIVKAYTTRVGFGPFPTELTGEIEDKIRNIGHEFGTTTGRKRRCGWLDAVQLRYANMVNGITDIALTKLDILTGFDPLKIATSYLINGKPVEGFPAQIETLEQVEVVYESLPGWKEDISCAKKFSDLPENAQKYVLRVEELVGVHVTWIGVGAARDAIIVRPN